VVNIGNITAFSFYATKDITPAEGEMVTANSDEMADKVKIVKLPGLSLDA